MPKKINPNDPVTRMVKYSFNHVATDLGSFKEEVAAEFTNVHGELDQIKSVLETILSVVQSLDADRKQQRAMADIPERVDHLEEDVPKLKTHVYSQD